MIPRMLRLAVTLAALTTLALVPRVPNTAHASPLVGPKQYYLVLGDSLAYGYQPNYDWLQGYSSSFFANLWTHGTRLPVNLACIDETSTTFIYGGCPYAALRKTFYSGSQLQAALAFIHLHSGQVSPVTLDIGANDLLPLFNVATCAAPSDDVLTAALNTFDANFTTILSQLRAALNGSGDLLTMNYYLPYLNQCPNFDSSAQAFNTHLQNDAAALGVPVADVATPIDASLCTYTWICSSKHDIHPTTAGYRVIAAAFENAVGY